MFYNTLSLISLTLSFLLGLFVYRSNKGQEVNKLFFFLVLSVMLWIFLNFLTDISIDTFYIKIWSKATIIGVILFLYFFYNLTKLFPKKKIVSRVFDKVMLCFSILFLVLVPTNFNIERVYFLNNQIPAIVVGPLYFIFLFYFIIVIFMSFRNLYSGYNKFDIFEKRQVQYITVGLGISVLFSIIVDLILPIFGNSNLVNYGPYSVLIFIVFTSIAIIKFKLFGIKIITTQLLVTSMWILILIRVFIADTAEEKILNIALLIILIFIGIFLIRNVIKEIALREKIEKLATDLESLNSTLSQKVEEQTREIKKSYELEKKAHRELEKLSETKDTFISLAQHNLRIPITNIDNKLRIILSSSEEKIGEKTKKILEEAKDSIINLTHIANDFKDISKLKIGSQILNLSSISLKPILENILNELNIDIQSMGLRVTYPTEANGWVNLKIDPQKIREVLIVIIENAVRYNMQNGKIEIRTKTFENNFEIKIKNTGIGLTYQEKDSLFQKSFYRGKRSQSINPTGMGIGLSVSKSIIEAHHGTMTIESKGENTGAEVTMSLPINFLNRVEKYN